MEVVVSFSFGMLLGALISALIVVSLWNKSIYSKDRIEEEVENIK